MTIQYLSAAAQPFGSFGTRQLPLGAGEHVISLFGVPDNSATGKQFGVNGKPGDIYTVPEGRRLRALQLDFAGVLAPATTETILLTLMDSLPDGSNGSDVAAFYPDVRQIEEASGGSAYNLIFNEKNGIDRPFVAGRQPRCRINIAGPTDVSLELYGIEGPA